MFSFSPHEAVERPRGPRRGAAAISAALIASLAALPTASAIAGAPPPGSGGASPERQAAVGQPSVVPGELLSTGQLEELLARLPLNSLSAAQLAHYLAGVEGIGGLAGLQGLLGKELGVAGLEKALAEAIEQLQLGNPSAKLGELANAGEVVPALEGRLKSLLELLGSPLGAEQKKALEQALGSLSLDHLVSSLLGSAKPGEQLATELSGLTGGLFNEIGSAELKGLLGSTPIGVFLPKTEKEVAAEVGSTPKAVDEQLGQTPAQLPETATMLTAPLTKGKVLGVAPAIKGLTLGVLGGAGEGSGSGSNGSGSGAGGSGSGQGSGSGGQGSSGESGHGGQGGSTGTVSIVLTLPRASSSTRAASTTAKGRQVGKVRILSHRVRGQVATVVLYIPAAGRIALTGGGVRSAVGRTTKAGRLTLSVHLSRAGAASLHRGHHHLAVKLVASFKPTGGLGSAATTTVHFA